MNSKTGKKISPTAQPQETMEIPYYGVMFVKKKIWAPNRKARDATPLVLSRLIEKYGEDEALKLDAYFNRVSHIDEPNAELRDFLTKFYFNVEPHVKPKVIRTLIKLYAFINWKNMLFSEKVFNEDDWQTFNETTMVGIGSPFLKMNYMLTSELFVSIDRYLEKKSPIVSEYIDSDGIIIVKFTLDTSRQEFSRHVTLYGRVLNWHIAKGNDIKMFIGKHRFSGSAGEVVMRLFNNVDTLLQFLKLHYGANFEKLEDLKILYLKQLKIREEKRKEKEEKKKKP